jgi:mannose-6-phosphate isomerase-like protein (cupin superfamily)
MPGQPGQFSSGTGQKAVLVLGEVITFKSLSADTDGAYTLAETITPPGGGAPPHLQHKDEEAFYVLEGTYSFLLGDELVEHGPGGYVFVPRGTVHSFQNAGDTPARMLILNSPGGYHEDFFLDVGLPVSDPENPPEFDLDQQIAKVLEVSGKYGIEMLPPPGQE